MRSRGSNLRRLSVPLKSDALTIEPSKLQKCMAQTQQFKPKLRLFRCNCCLYYLNSVFYSHIPTLVFTVTTLLRYQIVYIWAKSCSTKPYYIRVDTRDEFIFRTKFSQHHLSCGGGMFRIKVQNTSFQFVFCSSIKCEGHVSQQGFSGSLLAFSAKIGIGYEWVIFYSLSSQER